MALALVVTVVRTCLDALHVAHILLQFKLAYASRESMVIGCGKLVWDSRDISLHYMRSLRGFWLDAFVILPIPQVPPFISFQLILLFSNQISILNHLTIMGL